ncbi:class I SAM-dependent methyltransferase [Amycolatopsis sp. NEAU-NG30]|uniref:Class I SAM-dependent methyltransferase n=1 Tax=Amycolatopsis melonis TaxID=3156488 RepID=A0ABV0L771_9PSEU
MTDFDRPYWEAHWRHASTGPAEPNPHLVRETATLTPGTALDAGCGAGHEARWLASRGWAVTAVDISAAALARTAASAAALTRDTSSPAALARDTAAQDVEWVQADLTTWSPGRSFDLVVTHYAHPAMPQLDFYDRISRWVAPGGTLLVVAHQHGEASATPAGVTARLDAARWTIGTAETSVRTFGTATLHDVVVRATRRGDA